jgi:hypothetical protein
MKAFACQNCGQPLYFEAEKCESCGLRLGFLVERRVLSAMTPIGERADAWTALAEPDRPYRFCANAVHGACNWLVEADDPASPYCAVCRHNRTIPDLTDPDRLERWRRFQVAQHRLFDSLLAFGLPLSTRQDDREGLTFDILYDPQEHAPQGPSVITGHASGLITLNLIEADSAARERLRHDLDEPYRTLLGHFRHEVGHYYWDRLVRDGPMIEAFRGVFGDERASYEDALKRHYAAPPSSSEWRQHHVSAYAASHPWEDFAETWAHYLHMIDTLETAAAFGVRLNPSAETSDPADLDPYGEVSLDALIRAWLPLTFAVNSLNRSMGQPDLYPFLPAPAVILKLAFVHDLIRGGGAESNPEARSEDALKAVIAGLAVRVGDPAAAS